ncbi:DedA family protein [Microbacterium sp. X-17]|uniref:DedA family protein n=1 Tax=Microbacterium sp. X-17 TaxID=3144404 RepID=UPI0031F58BC4
MNEVLTWLLDVVQSVDPLVRTLLAGVAMLLETSVLVGLVVPGDTVVLVASTAVASPLEGVVLGVAVVAGSLAGESIGFWLGRWLGPVIRRSWIGRRIGEPNWERAQRYLDRRGGLAIFLSRFIPVLHSLVPLTVGMSGYRYRRFLAWTLPACVLWAAVYITVGSAAAGGFRQTSQEIHYAGYLFVAVILLFVIGIAVGKHLLTRAERRHLEDAPPAAEDMED